MYVCVCVVCAATVATALIVMEKQSLFLWPQHNNLFFKNNFV